MVKGRAIEVLYLILYLMGRKRRACCAQGVHGPSHTPHSHSSAATTPRTLLAASATGPDWHGRQAQVRQRRHAARTGTSGVQPRPLLRP